MTSYPLALATLGVALISLSCGSPHAAAGPGETPYQWDLPRGFPEPQVPASNPMSAAKVRLGRYLFYDRRMSVNGAGSCASCHRQERAFTDGRAAAVGPTGERTPRSAMSIANAAYASTLTWSDPGAHSLEDLVLETMHSEAPLEIGLGRVRDQFVSTLRTDPVYRSLFPTAFSAGPEPYTITNAAKAIAAFVRTIVSADSPYDRYYYGGREDALSDSAKRGELLFFTDPVASCYRCHGGFNFSDAVSYVGQAPYPVEFHNTGLYNLPGRLSFPPPSLGIYEHTKLPEDIGKFKAPTLRNIALTGPYMHDGSILNLEEVLDHYAAGGRTIKAGEYAGVGHNNPNLDKRIRPLRLTAQNRRDLIAFLRSLSDERLTRLSRYSNPW